MWQTKYASAVQVNLCQKLLFLHQPTRNMTTDCCFIFFDIQNNFGTQHVLQMLRASEKDLPVPKNLGLGFDFRPCSEGDFLIGRP